MRQVGSLQVNARRIQYCTSPKAFKIVGLYVHVVFYVVLVCVCIDASDLAQMTNGADGRRGREVRRGRRPGGRAGGTPPRERASAYGHGCALGARAGGWGSAHLWQVGAWSGRAGGRGGAGAGGGALPPAAMGAAMGMQGGGGDACPCVEGAVDP